MSTMSELLDAIRQAESGGNDRAISPAGARGPYQFMPRTAAEFGLRGDEVFDPVASREAASRKMTGLLKQYGNDTPMALAAYNLGQGNLAKVGGDYSRVPETRNYVTRVMGMLNPISTANASEQPYQETQPLSQAELKALYEQQQAEEQPQAELKALYEQQQAEEQPQADAGQAGKIPSTIKDFIAKAAFGDPGKHHNIAETIKGIGSGVFESIGNLPRVPGNRLNDALIPFAKTQAEDSRPNSNAVGRFIGNAVPAVVAAAATSGLGLPAMAAAQGAVTGMTTPGSLQDRAVNAGISALLSGVSAKILTPRLAKAPGAAELEAMGVPLTPGQTAGGIVKRLEDLATSLPLTGHGINAQRTKSLLGFNTAEINKAISSLGAGAKVTVPGHVGITEADNLVSKGYTDILSGSTAKLVRPQVTKAMEEQLSQLNIGRFKSAIDQIYAPLGNQVGSHIPGEDVKQIVSMLRAEGRNYAASTVPEDRYLKKHLDDAAKQVHNQFKSANVAGKTIDLTPKLDQVDTAYKRMLPIQDAANAPGSAEGVFNPNTLLRVTGRVAKKAGQGKKLAQGKIDNQIDLEAAQRILPSNVADSGSIQRGLWATMLGGYGHPLIPTIDALGRIATTAPVQNNLVKPWLFNQNKAPRSIAALLGALSQQGF